MRPSNSAADRLDAAGNQEIRQHYNRSNGQHRNQRPNEQQHGRKDHVRNEEASGYRNKEITQRRTQSKPQQEHKQRTREHLDEQSRNDRETSYQKQNNKEAQQRDNTKRDNHRNNQASRTERVEKISKQTEVRHGNPSGTKDQNDQPSKQQNNRKDGSYRKDYPRYEKADRKDFEARGGIQQHGRTGKIGEKQSDELPKQSGRASKAEQDIRVSGDGTIERSRKPQQGQGKQKERDGRIPRRDEHQYTDNNEVSNKKQENASKIEEDVPNRSGRAFVMRTGEKNASGERATGQEMEKREKGVRERFVPVEQSEIPKRREQDRRYGNDGYETRKQVVL